MDDMTLPVDEQYYPIIYLKTWGRLYQGIKCNVTSDPGCAVTIAAKVAVQDIFVTVIKDKKTGQPLGSCFVKFQDAEFAKIAKSQLTGILCEDKKLIVMADSGGRLQEDLIDDRMQKLAKKNSERLMSSSVMSSKETMLSNEEDNMTTYGLSLEFLESLGIAPPLSNRLFIVNLDFKVDEEKLREVFGLAGKVLSVNIQRTSNGTSKGMAQIEYDHPVEAVQAISMFNLQIFYDRQISVRFDRIKPKTKTLPDGLKTVGLGLGPNGAPLRAVRNFIELQPLKKLLKQLESANITTNTESNTASHQTQDNISGFNQQQMVTNTALANPLLMNSLSTPINTMGVNLIPHSTPMGLEVAQNTTETVNAWLPNAVAINTTATLNPNATINATATPTNIWNMNSVPSTVGFNPVLAGNNVNNQNLQLLQALMQAQQVQGVQNNLTSLATLGSNQAVVQNVMGFAQAQPLNQVSIVKPLGQYTNESENITKDHTNLVIHKDNTQMEQKPMLSDMVVITNLPPSVTLSILRDKMREVGEVRMAEMTSQDTAIVRFMNSWEAERCKYLTVLVWMDKLSKSDASKVGPDNARPSHLVLLLIKNPMVSVKCPCPGWMVNLPKFTVLRLQLLYLTLFTY
ncbi:Myelin expression factor 2 [Eumeta japonica]|uniref:Myelin expression factor 2 n=1 Tax=Eumeta variegata TaxID=151549 RepID=A0A4C1XH23_EUMVA|nr:Myelin expression factor 2 [Eumeta japonica]